MDLPLYLQNLYDYHYWANHRYLDAAAGLSEAQYLQPQGQSWGSVHATLLHMVNAEWVWLSRWQGRSPREFPRSGDTPTLALLRERWAALEPEVRGFVAAQTPESVMREVAYTTTAGVPHRVALWQLMAHVPNHATHHRGELAAMFALLDAPHSEEDMNKYFLEGK